MSTWSRMPLRVICLSSGQLYESITAASKDAGVAASTLLRAIQASRLCAGKYWAMLPSELDEGTLERWRMAQLLRCVGYESSVKEG